MDRMRMRMILLLVGTAVLGAGAAHAQGHDPAAAAQRLREQQRDTPAARARLLAEKHAWLQRLVGRFHGESVDSTVRASLQPFQSTSTYSSVSSETPETAWSQLFYTRSAQKQGRAECVALEAEVGVSCLLDLKTQQGEGTMTAFRVMLPLVPPDDYGRIPESHGSLHLGLVDATRMEWVALDGNTAIFKVDCTKAVPGMRARMSRRARTALCRQQVRITARPDGSRVKVSLESSASRTTLMDLNRARPQNAGGGDGLRSGQ
jgi:hypothetical protein